MIYVCLALVCLSLTAWFGLMHAGIGMELGGGAWMWCGIGRCCLFSVVLPILSRQYHIRSGPDQLQLPIHFIMFVVNGNLDQFSVVITHLG